MYKSNIVKLKGEEPLNLAKYFQKKVKDEIMKGDYGYRE